MSSSALQTAENRFAALTGPEIRKLETDVLRAIADLALVPPVIDTDPLPEFDYDRLDYGMTPAVTRTPGGRLWNLWFAGEDGPSAFLLANISDDDGETWSKPLLAVNGQAPERFPVARSIVMGHIWCDPLGILHLFFSQSMLHFDGRASTWESVCENPDDDVPVWSKPRWIWHGGVHNKPIVTSKGEWLLPLDLEIDGYGCYQGVFSELDPVRGMHVFASTDQGKSWRPRGFAVPRAEGVSHYAEHMIVERSDRSLWMLIRTNMGLMESYSLDDGRNWSEPVFSRTVSHPCSRFFLTRLASGRILLVKHGDRIDDFFRDGAVDWSNGRNRLKAFLSEDDGESWIGGLMLDERQVVSYPDGFQAPDGGIYVVYDRNRATDGEILLARFAEQDVLNGRLGPGSKLRMPVCRPLKGR